MSDESWSESGGAAEANGPADDSNSSGSGWGWSDAAGEAASHLLGNLLETESRTSSRPATTSNDTPLINPVIKALFLASFDRPAIDQRSLVRQLAEGERWYLPTAPSGGPLVEILRRADDQLREAFAVPLVHGGKRRRWSPPKPQQGQPPRPVRLLRIWADDPGRPARLVSGYELARLLPSDLDALVVMHGAQPGIGLWAADFAPLMQFADARDLEALLLHPAPGQLEAVRSARWYVPSGKAALRAETYGFDRMIRVYTQPEDGYENEQPLQELSGSALCARLAKRGDYDGIVVNISSGITSGTLHEPRFELGPDFARSVVAGIDPRPGVRPLPARTLAEVALWADIVEFAWENRELVPVDDPPGAVQVRATGTSRWRPDQPVRSNDFRPGPVAGPIFTISQPGAPPGDLGEGQTEILCAGLLAQYLYTKATWYPPRWFVSRRERAQAARLASIAVELEKLLPAGRDQLPRSTIRTVTGASFLRRRETYGSRRWIREMFERYHRAATHWLPSLR